MKKILLLSIFSLSLFASQDPIKNGSEAIDAYLSKYFFMNSLDKFKDIKDIEKEYKVDLEIKEQNNTSCIEAKSLDKNNKIKVLSFNYKIDKTIRIAPCFSYFYQPEIVKPGEWAVPSNPNRDKHFLISKKVSKTNSKVLNFEEIAEKANDKYLSLEELKEWNDYLIKKEKGEFIENKTIVEMNFKNLNKSKKEQLKKYKKGEYYENK